MPAIIDPHKVHFVFENADGTSTVGVEQWNSVTNKPYVDQHVVSRLEGNQLGEMMRKRQEEQVKLQKAAGQPPPSLQQHTPSLLRDHRGRPVSMQDIMKVRKKAGP